MKSTWEGLLDSIFLDFDAFGDPTWAQVGRENRAKTGQDRTRQGKTGQDKTRQDKISAKVLEGCTFLDIPYFLYSQTITGHQKQNHERTG